MLWCGVGLVAAAAASTDGVAGTQVSVGGRILLSCWWQTTGVQHWAI
jgi:hypothetical protein